MCRIVGYTGILNTDDDAMTAFPEEMSYHGSTFFF